MTLKIGDTIPIAPDSDLSLVPSVMYQRGLTARQLTGGKMQNQAYQTAANNLKARLDAEKAAETPVERAKLYLRRKGWKPVFKDAKGFHVGSRSFRTVNEFLSFAQSKGWTA